MLECCSVMYSAVFYVNTHGAHHPVALYKRWACVLSFCTEYLRLYELYPSNFTYLSSFFAEWKYALADFAVFSSASWRMVPLRRMTGRMKGQATLGAENYDFYHNFGVARMSQSMVPFCVILMIVL